MFTNRFWRTVIRLHLSTYNYHSSVCTYSSMSPSVSAENSKKSRKKCWVCFESHKLWRFLHSTLKSENLKILNISDRWKLLLHQHYSWTTYLFTHKPVVIAACHLYGCLGAVFGTCSIMTMVVIGYDRYNVIVKGFTGIKITAGKVSLST